MLPVYRVDETIILARGTRESGAYRVDETIILTQGTRESGLSVHGVDETLIRVGVDRVENLPDGIFNSISKFKLIIGSLPMIKKVVSLSVKMLGYVNSPGTKSRTGR